MKPSIFDNNKSAAESSSGKEESKPSGSSSSENRPAASIAPIFMSGFNKGAQSSIFPTVPTTGLTPAPVSNVFGPTGVQWGQGPQSQQQGQKQQASKNPFDWIKPKGQVPVPKLGAPNQSGESKNAFQNYKNPPISNPIFTGTNKISFPPPPISKPKDQKPEQKTTSGPSFLFPTIPSKQVKQSEQKKPQSISNLFGQPKGTQIKTVFAGLPEGTTLQSMQQKKDEQTSKKKDNNIIQPIVEIIEMKKGEKQSDILQKDSKQASPKDADEPKKKQQAFSLPTFGQKQATKPSNPMFNENSKNEGEARLQKQATKISFNPLPAFTKDSSAKPAQTKPQGINKLSWITGKPNPPIDQLKSQGDKGPKIDPIMPKINLFSGNKPEQTEVNPPKMQTIVQVSEEQVESKDKQQKSTDNKKQQKKVSFIINPSSPFKKTNEQNILQNKQQQIPEKKDKQNNQKNTFSAFQFTNNKKNITPSPSIRNRQDFFQIHKLCDILTKQDEQFIIENAQKIQKTMRKYLTISTQVNIKYQPQQIEQYVKQNQGVNKLLNDFTLIIAKILKIPKQSYILFGELFYKMLKQKQMARNLFDDLKLNEYYIIHKRIYKSQQGNNLVLLWEEGEAAKIICQFIQYFSSLTTQCLKKMKNVLIPCFKKTTIYDLFLQTSLLLNQRLPQTQSLQIIDTMKASDLRMSNHLNKLLSVLIQSWYSTQTNLQFITRQQILKLISIVNEHPISPSTKIFQRILLRTLNLNKPQQKLQQNKRIIDKLSVINSKLLLPFRVILHRLDKSKKYIQPFQKDLFQQIDGPEWADWLSLYLGEDNLRLKQKEMPYLINALKAMRVKNIDKIINKQSQIKRLIHLILQQSQVKVFYEILSTIIYDENSIRQVQKQFFNDGRVLKDDLRLLADEVRKFPNCEQNQEDMPELHAKSLYFLTVLAIKPQRAFEYENALFDMMGFIDSESQRCDRICNLVIDILAYFSVKQFDTQIVIKCFSAMNSLFSTNSTKFYMSLAMNVNRPQLDFFNKNVPKNVLQKIDNFLTQIISNKQFYDSTKVSDQSLSLSKAYPFRYSIQRYLSTTSEYKPVVPLYWFSNCLKVSMKQSYNPELLQTILSKLKINPSKTIITQIPYILATIVDACNISNFWKDFNNYLAAFHYSLQNKFGVYNRYLLEKPDLQIFINVFFSLNLLNTMLQLRKIRNFAQKNYPRHFIAQLLSSLTCLNQLERHYMQGVSDIQVFSTNSISPIVGLFALTCEDSTFINTSATIKTQWLYSQNLNIKLDEIKKLHSQAAANIDYSILRDVLIHPHNKNLDCYENIASLAFSCLNQILSESTDISIEGLLYMCVPKEKTINIQNFNDLKIQIISSFIRALENPIFSLSRKAWKLLLIMRNNPNSKKFTQDVFREYNKINRMTDEKMKSNKYYVQFLCHQIKQKSFNNADLITEILEILQKIRTEHTPNLQDLLEQYVKKSGYTESLHQFQRLMTERKIIELSQLFETIKYLIEIVLNQLYINGSIYFSSLTRHSSLLIKIISQLRLINIYSANKVLALAPQYILNDLNNPRLHGEDILQNYITQPQKTREQLVLVQVQNVRNWCNKLMEQINKSITTFLSVILSIDQTCYANHAIKIKTKKHSQLFCQLHIPIANYKGQQLVGRGQRQAQMVIKNLIQAYLQKIQQLRQIGRSDEIIKCYVIVDMLLSWLKSNRNTKKSQLVLLCKRVLSICSFWLGGPILQSVTAKLVLTCANILQNQLTPDMLLNLRQTIAKTMQSIYTLTPDIKQQLLALLVIVPPQKHQSHILQLVAKLWCHEQNNQYFYNQCRVMLKLCQLYPVEMAKLKILSRCERILRLQDSSLQGIRYREGMRTVEAKSWAWILKIVTSLLENNQSSTIVVHQVSKFIDANKKRLIFTLNQPRQAINLKNKTKNLSIELSLAQLDQIEATLELFIVLSQSKLWIQMNRVLFEEMFYYLMHRTVIMFAPSSMGDRLKKRYIPFSINEKIMWKLHAGEGLIKQQYQQMVEGYDPDIINQQIATQMIDFALLRPSAFILSMSLKFNDCLKLWLLACSNGMRSSCFVREYFSKPITTDWKGSNLKYSLTHWDHHNKAIIQIIQSLMNRINEWGKWEDKTQLLDLLNDSFNSAQLFTETGYLYSLSKFPLTDDQLIAELGESLSFALEMGACHLSSQIYFRNKNGTFSKQTLQNFQQRLLKLQALSQEKLIQNKIDRKDFVFDHLSASKAFLKQIQI